MSLQIGDKAPDFALQNQDGNTIRLSDLQGKKVVLYFYPNDNTPGCSAQSSNLMYNYEDLQAASYQSLDISSDSQQSHKQFAAMKNLAFPLLVDDKLSVHHDYHTWVENQM